MSLLEKASLICTPNAYKTSKLYSVVPNTTLGDMDVVRATTATRVNSAGLISSVGVNIPRIDYTNGSCPSLLVEPQRTNLALYSEQFDNVVWERSSVNVTLNSAISPDGNNTADKIIPTSTAAKYLFQNSPVVLGQSYTYSIFAKKGEYNFIQIVMDSTGFTGTPDWFNVDLTNGTFGNQVITNITNKSIIQLSNGWYKISVTKTALLTTSTGRAIFSPLNSDYNSRLPLYTSDGTSGIYLWGAQLEQGSYATSYIPTVASTVTRNADVISKTGISSLIGQTEGTVYVEGKFNDISVAFKRLLFISDSGVTNTIQLRSGANASSLQVVFSKNGATQVLSSTSIVSFTNMNKIAVRYSLNNVKLFINGAFVLQDTSCEIPINLSNFSVSDETTIKTEILFQTALTDQECIALTTL